MSEESKVIQYLYTSFLSLTQGEIQEEISMSKMTFSTNGVRSRLARLKQRKEEIEKFLANAPEGSLICKKAGGRYIYYRNCKGRQSYISKTDSQMLRQLAVKKLSKKSTSIDRRLQKIYYLVRNFCMVRNK